LTDADKDVEDQLADIRPLWFAIKEQTRFNRYFRGKADRAERMAEPMIIPSTT